MTMRTPSLTELPPLRSRAGNSFGKLATDGLDGKEFMIAAPAAADVIW